MCFVHIFSFLIGKYIFIESSDYETSSVTAVLASGVVDSSERTCIQFWYHMRGREIGILNVYIRTNETRTLIWQLAGEQGDNWNFGQVGYKGDSPYEVRHCLHCCKISIKELAQTDSLENV